MLKIINAKLLNYKNLQNVLFKKGKIWQISETIDAKCKCIDAKGKLLLPGIIDLNVKFKNKIFHERNLKTLSKDAIKGGVTSFVVLPNFKPRFDDDRLIEFINKKLAQKNSFLSASLIKEDGTLNNIASFVNMQTKCIWSNSSTNTNLLRRGLQYAIMKEIPIMFNCYDPGLDDKGSMHEGEVSFQLGLTGISKIAEIAEVSRVCEILIHFKSKALLQALSTQKSLQIVKNAKEQGANVFSEVSIHHFLRNDTSCENFNTYAKLKPPLRDEEERKKLIIALKDGLIDILSSTHSPHSLIHKDVAFIDAYFGIDSIREYFSLAYTKLVKENIISIEKLMQLVSKNPAQLLGLNKGEIKEGYDGDCILFDENYSFEIQDENSIYFKEKLQGKVCEVFIKGKLASDKELANYI